MYGYHIKNFSLSVIIIVLSNLVIYLLAFWTGTERVEFNIDYFIPLLFLFFRSKILFFISFFLIFFIDFLNIFAQIFPFIRLSDLFYLLKFSFISSNTYKLYAFFLVVALALQLFIIFRLFKKENGKYYLFIFNIMILIYAYVMNFGDTDRSNFWKPSGSHIISSQLLNYLDYRNRGFIKNYNNEDNVFQKAFIPGATLNLFEKKNRPEKILLVINESWGVPNDFNIQRKLLQSVSQQPQVQNMKLNELSFDGFTIGGELRELCRKAPAHFNLKHQEKGFEDCLPNLLKQNNYHTIAAHGALGLMYDRQYWYPRAGFSELLFRDKGLNLPESNCYSFPGNCDVDIANRLVDQFQQHDKLFVYWLTLNTHAIYDLRDLKVDKFECEKFNISPNSGTCRNLKLQTQFFITLSTMIKTGKLSGTKVIVVGDHEPPIIREEKKVFLKNTVPIFEFDIK